jgi:hypothetical protein
MEESHETALRTLIRTFQSVGYAASEQESACYFRPLELSIYIRHADISSSNDQHVASISYETSSHRLPLPLYIICTGIGKSMESAAEAAAKQWFHLVLPTLQAFLSKKDEEFGVKTGTMTSMDGGSRQLFGWKMYIGPIHTTVFGSNVGITPIEQTDFLYPLVGPLSSISIHSNFFYLDAYAAKTIEKKAIADCRVNNHQWEEGTTILYKLAKNWKINKAVLKSHRQIILFEPTAPADDSETKAKLMEAASQYAEKPNWLQRLLGKR